MKIKSAYTQTELEFDVMEKTDPVTGKTMTVIKHDALRDVIYNQLDLTKEGSVDYRFIRADLNHAVVECTINDGKGRMAKEVGESTTPTLTDEIAQSYPVLIASQRAFDRAAILLLKLAGKQLSNVEMCQFAIVDFEPAIESDFEPTNEELSVQEAPIEDAPTLMNIPDGVDELEDLETEQPAPKPAIVTSEVQEIEKEEPADSSESNNLGSTLIAIGPYEKKPATLDDVYKINKTYLTTLLTLRNPNEKIKPTIDIIRQYFEALGQE